MEQLLFVRQAAELLGTTVRFPRRLVAERRTRFVPVGRHVRIPLSALGPYSAWDCGTGRRADHVAMTLLGPSTLWTIDPFGPVTGLGAVSLHRARFPFAVSGADTAPRNPLHSSTPCCDCSATPVS